VGADVLLGNQRGVLKKEFSGAIHDLPRRHDDAARLMMKSINLDFAEAHSLETTPSLPSPLGDCVVIAWSPFDRLRASG
jgi:hypothetical protein